MVDPKKIKITLPIPAGSGNSGSSSVAWMHLHGMTVEESATRVEKKSGMFSGAEEEPPRDKALKKIQIEIVRNLKGNANYSRHSSPVRRSLKPYDTLLLPRRTDEGQTPLFDFIQALTETTKRIISLDAGGDEGKRGSSGRRRSRSRSPLRNKNRSRSPLEKKRASNFYSDVGGSGGAGDVRARLGNKGDRENRDERDRHQSRRQSGSPAGRRPTNNIHSRLGQRREGGGGSDVRSRLSNRADNGRMTDDEDDGQVLNREELESQRPAAPPPWEANPEMVPRGGYYFEHDDREGDRGGDRRFGNRFGGRGGGFRGRFQRGGFRGRGMGNRGFYDRRGRDSSPDWKHDKFDPGPEDDQA